MFAPADNSKKRVSQRKGNLDMRELLTGLSSQKSVFGLQKVTISLPSINSRRRILLPDIPVLLQNDSDFGDYFLTTKLRLPFHSPACIL